MIATQNRAPFAGLLATLAMILGAGASAPVAAEPYLALRSGLKCAVCHVNGTGGGKRTVFGTNYSQTILAHRMVQPGGKRTVFDPRIGENVTIGGDLRVRSRSVLRPGDDSNGFDFSEGNLYLQVDLVPEFLTFYLDEAVAPGGAASREAFILVQDPKRQLAFKAGRLLLPYGWRLWDDDAYIRRLTGFNYQAQDLGVEVAWRPGRWSTALAITNGTQGGTENNREKKISVVASRIYPGFRVGASFSHNQGPEVRRVMAGVFAGVFYGPLTLLGEVDVIDDHQDASDEEDAPLPAGFYGRQRMAYVEGNVLITRGVTAKFAWEYWDEFEDVDEDGRETYRIGLEPFVTQFLQLRTFYRHRKAPPQLREENQDWLTVELHAFF